MFMEIGKSHSSNTQTLPSQVVKHLKFFARWQRSSMLQACLNASTKLSKKERNSNAWRTTAVVTRRLYSLHFEHLIPCSVC